MDTLSVRKEEILQYVINSYIDTMQPIGSRTLTRKYDLNLSAATIRNEMCDLEELGFLTHPHISAGRVPTDKGYRYFVDHLLAKERIPEESIRVIKKEFKRKLDSISDLIEKTSRIVSTISQEACIAVLFRPDYFLFKQIDLIPLDERRILVIWVTTLGLVKNEIVDLKETISADYLQRISHFLNSELRGRPLEEIESYILRKLEKQRDSLYRMYQYANQIVKASLVEKTHHEKLYLEGRNFILGKPEFQNIQKTKRIFEILEDKYELLDLLDDYYEDTTIKVRIGKENRCHDLWDCSLISALYTLRGSCIGTINILGPKRIHYGRLITLLRYISGMMTETVNKLEGI